MKSVMKVFVLVIGLCEWTGLSVAYGDTSAFSSDMLKNDILTQVESPLAFDWRKSSFELDVGYDYLDEQTSFNTDGYHLGVMIPDESGFHLQLGIRRIIVYSTASTNDLGRTPFKQRSSRTRYQIYAGAAYSLLEGLAITRLSPKTPDVETVLLATLHFFYNHPNKRRTPAVNDEPDTLPGMEPYEESYGLDFGLRWQFYSQFGLGFYVGVSRQFYPFRSKGLSGNLIAIGLLGSFGQGGEDEG